MDKLTTKTLRKLKESLNLNKIYAKEEVEVKKSKSVLESERIGKLVKDLKNLKF